MTVTRTEPPITARRPRRSFRRSLHRSLHRSLRRAALRPRAAVREAGSTAAEYAIVLVGGCLFAGLLIGILTSGQVRQLLVGLVQRALTVG